MARMFESSFDKQSLSLKVPRHIHQALKFHCLDSGKTMQDILGKLIEDYVLSNGFIKSRASVKKKVSLKRIV